MSLQKIDSHVEDGLKRLLSQFKNSYNLKSVISAFINGHQNIEDAFFDLYLLRQLDVAFGAQLDKIGEIVGRPRQGFDDEKYRLRLYGQIAINTSKGLPENLIWIFNILTGSTSSVFSEYPIAETSIFGNVPPSSGIELLLDGDMESPTVASWTSENNAVLTKEINSPYAGLQSLRVSYNGISEPAASQSILEIGQWYIVNGRVRMENNLGPIPQVKNGSNLIYFGYAYDSWYEFDIVFFSSDPKISFGSDHSASGWVEYDNVSVELLKLDNFSEIYQICQSVVPGGVRLNGMGWFDGQNAFAFFDSPDGKGFGDTNDPNVGGKFASITNFSI